ncbi:MAG: flavodoxin family protein [Methanobacteriaceae archaeon]|nr:flavodoxin family protein [Methanobacteriaceae archaeon]
MTKKVLILMGSPRTNGNTNILSEQFKKGAQETKAEVEIIKLQEKEINYCLGCNECFKQKNDYCLKQTDDVNEILDKMEEANIIVFATPVYFYTMSGQLKTLIDRTVPRYMKIQNKEIYYILAAATSDKSTLERTVEEFRGYLACLPNPQEKGIIYGYNAWEIGEINNTPAVEEAYFMGKNIQQ